MIKIYNKDIDLELTLLSGQCFRQIKNEDDSFDVILKDRVINIKREKDYLIVTSNNEKNLKDIVIKYFDLDFDYNSVNKELISRDKSYRKIIDCNKGYHILNQDNFEMYISYIISQNNNVSRISKIINNMCSKYGKQIIFNNKKYYLFPTYDDLKNITIEDLQEFKLGFRDKYIINALNKINENNFFLEDINKNNSVNSLKELMSIKGIGMKVASCILLFSYHKLDVYPIDTWVKQYMVKRNINTNNIKNEMIKLFGNYSGLMIQYIFNYERNIKSVDK